MLLTFQINKQLICRTDKEIPVADSENFLYAEFSFSEEWEGTKTAIFNNGTPYSVMLENDKCLVPWEVITASGFSVSVYCGERITANTSFVKVLPSGYVEGQTPQPPSKTVYDQILDELDTKLEPTNIKAGDNVTVTRNGNDVTISSQGGGGTGDYADLENKPKINSIELVGNKSLSDLGIQPSGNYATQSDLATKQDKDFVVTFTDGTPVTSDKTLSEIYSAFTSGKYIYGKMGNTLYSLLFVSADNIAFHSVTLYNLTTLVMTSSGITKVDSVYQPQLNAGAGISISGNVISATASFTIAVVQILPETGNTQTIYLVPNGGTTPNIYDEYVYVNSAWEKIGTTEVDLSNYYKKSEVDTLLSAKIGTSAIKQSTGQSTSDLMSQKAVTDELSGKLSNPLIFTNVSASSWVDNATTPDTYFENYAYKCVLSCQGVTSSMLATVIFADAQKQSEKYSDKCSTGTDTITIYSNDNSAISIPTIVAGVPIEVEANEQHAYSTDEQVVGTWIDGSTLYEKTVVLSQNEIYSGEHTYSMNLGASFVIYENGIAKNGSYYEPIPNGHSDMGQWGFAVYDIKSTEFKMNVGYNAFNRGVDTVCLTFRYTKSS